MIEQKRYQGRKDGAIDQAKYRFVMGVNCKIGFDLLRHLDWKFEYKDGYPCHGRTDPLSMRWKDVKSYCAAITYKGVDYWTYVDFTDHGGYDAIPDIVDKFVRDVVCGLLIRLIKEEV